MPRDAARGEQHPVAAQQADRDRQQPGALDKPRRRPRPATPAALADTAAPAAPADTAAPTALADTAAPAAPAAGRMAEGVVQRRAERYGAPAQHHESRHHDPRVPGVGRGQPAELDLSRWVSGLAQ